MAGLDFIEKDQEADERLNPASGARNLYQQEHSANDGFDESASSGQDAGSGTTTKNIDDTREQEQAGPDASQWEDKTTKPSSSQKTPMRARIKKNGPLGLIIALLGGGLGGEVITLGPAALVLDVKATITDKLNSTANTIGARANNILEDRMFSTSGKLCTIKIRCRYSGLTEEQMNSLRQQGAELLDAKGKPVEKNALGRYTGGKTLILDDKTPVTAKDYAKTMRSNQKLRDLTRGVFNPRFSGEGTGSKEVQALRAQDKLTTQPAFGEDEQQARKNLYQETAGNPLNVVEQGPSAQDQFTTDSNGNQVPKNANQRTIPGMGDMADAANAQAQELEAAATKGDLIPSLPADPAAAAMMPESPASVSVGKKIVGFFNPADFIVGMCGTYKITSTIVTIARTIMVINMIRYMTAFFSEADKIRAGDATAGGVEQAANILESPDAYGDTFGDAASYQYAKYGVLPDKMLTASVLGSGVIQVFAEVLHWINKTMGGGNAHTGKQIIKEGCNILTNPIVQGALALTSFIPGGGQIANGLKTVVTTGARDFAQNTIKDLVTNLVKAAAQKVAANLTKDALKNAAKVALKEFLKMAAGAAGIFLASYLVERYAIPYLGRIISNAVLPTDGVQSVDTQATGYAAYDQKIGQMSGNAPLTPAQASAFNQFNSQATATYVADMRAESNPLDFSDPYSAGTSVASAFRTFTSQLMGSSLLGAPAAILSSLNPSKLFASTALADTNSNGVYEMCQQDDFISGTGLATTPFCTFQMGSNDVGMLQNADPDTDIATWMLNNQQIDSNGDPIANSDYAWFKQNCPVSDKDITDAGEESQQIDPKCYDTKTTSSTEWKYFYNYTLDGVATDNMDNAQPSTSANPSDATPVYIAAGSIPQSGMVVGASVFGGTLQNGKWIQNLADNGGTDKGNHDNHMTGTPAFAELANGTALGGLPDNTRLEISYNGKTVIAIKADVGGGGPDVNGHKRAIDLWWQTANALGLADGTAVVTIHAVDPGTPLTQVAAMTNSLLKNIGSFLTDYRPFMSYARGAF